MYVSEHPAGECPTVSELLYGHYLDRSARTNRPWDRSFRIECGEDDVVVVSAGADQDWDTEDDISSPQH
jgi:hypothetical protein